MVGAGWHVLSGHDANDPWHTHEEILMKAIQSVIVVVALVAACAKQAPPPAIDAAQLVFRNGNLYTVDASHPSATSIAIRDGRIVALGSDQDTAALIGPNTHVVDLQGKLVLPAFHDAHTHPVWGGLNYSRCPLYDGNSPAEYQKIIAKCAADEPGTGWLYGVGWKDGLFTPEGVPHKELLDAVAPDRPAAFISVGGHSIWVNSKALEVAGITRKTPDPPNGHIDRDAKGDAIGALQESAVELITKKLPPPSPTEQQNALRYAQKYFHGIGVVGLHDASVPIYTDDPDEVIPPKVPEVYAALTKSGELKEYVNLALTWDDRRGVEQIPDLLAASKRIGEMGVEAKAVKFFMDGVPAQRSAALLEPYSDKPGFRGALYIPKEVFEEAVTQLDANGMQVHVHAIGDWAVRAALDAFAKARERNGPKDNRHLVSHVNLISAPDMARFAQLNATAVFQPSWACMDEYMVMVGVRVGQQRLDRTYPAADLMRAGGRVAYGSDWPVASANPLEGIEVALTRRLPGTTEGPQLAATEAVTLTQAIESYTLQAAIAGHREDRSGSLTVGKNADLVVLDRDLFKVPVNEISKARVLLTLFKGEAVFGDLTDVSGGS
jgi:predicted amidohydrolase YtcJ